MTHSEPIRCELRASVGSVARTLSSGAFRAERPSARSLQGGHHRSGRLETHTKRQAAWEQGQQSRCHHEPWLKGTLESSTQDSQATDSPAGGAKWGQTGCSGCLGNEVQSRFYLPSGRGGSEPSQDCLQLKQNRKSLALIRGRILPKWPARRKSSGFGLLRQQVSKCSPQTPEVPGGGQGLQRPRAIFTTSRCHLSLSLGWHLC